MHLFPYSFILHVNSCYSIFKTFSPTSTRIEELSVRVCPQLLTVCTRQAAILSAWLAKTSSRSRIV